MSDYIDGYCERVAPGLLGEPLNAITNLSFLLAALVLWRVAGRHGTRTDPVFLVPWGLLVATGIGSLAFHTMANRFGAILDTAALSLCLLVTIWFGARRWLGWSWLAAALWPVGMVGAALLLGRHVPVGGAAYLGPFVTGAALASLLMIRRHPAGRWVAAAVAVFVPSFIFRTLDMPLCGDWPVGTHFAWHLLNGMVLGLAIAPFAIRMSAGTNPSFTRH
ncbi:MAG: ceramidase domain-containing protein [Pseudomonadota bacterium]|nr:ceramidase domain-containing protein [Pseudomonadota bacterium]